MGIEEHELDAALGEDVLAGLGQVIEDDHGGVKVDRGHISKVWWGSLAGKLERVGMCFARRWTQRA